MRQAVKGEIALAWLRPKQRRFEHKIVPQRGKAPARVGPVAAPTTQAALIAPMETPVTALSVTAWPLPIASSISSSSAVIAPYS